MATGLTITLIGMATVFLLLALMISVVKLLSVVFSAGRISKKSRLNREEREMAIALAALKNVLG